MEYITYAIVIILALFLGAILHKYLKLKSQFRTIINNEETNLFNQKETLLLLYRRLYESNSEGLWVIRFRKKIVLDKDPGELAEEMYENMYFADCNNTFPKLMLLNSKSDIIGKDLKDIPNISRRILIHELETMIRNNRLEFSMQIETPFVDKNNHFSNQIFGVIENNELKEMVGVLRDFSQFMKIQNELIDLKFAIDKTTEGICISDGIKSAFYINKAFTEITGYTLEEIQNTTLSALFLDKKSNIYRTKEGIQRLQKNGGSWSGRAIIKTKDGSYKQIVATITAIEFDSSPNTRFITVFSDVTTEVKLEEALLQSQKLQAMGTLTGGVAHDFNNVLTVILGNTDYLIRNYDSVESEDLLDSLQIIDRSAKQAEAQTRRLLAFSRKTDTRKKTIHLDKWLSEIKPLYSKLVSKDTKLTMQLNAESAICSIDNSLFELVLLNLVKNATHAINGDGRIEIRSSLKNYRRIGEFERKILEPDQDYALIEVEDNGSGMSKEVQERIFEPFFTTKDEDKGTGLGLSMVYGIVEEHNGNISVKSELNKGTVFSIYIPVTESDRDVPNTNMFIRGLIADDLFTIIIDEDKSFGRVMGKLFRSRNLKYEYGQTFEEAKEIVKTVDCKNVVVVMSTDPAKANGKNPIKELKEINPNLKCIVIGTCNKSVTESQIILKCDDTLCKPFTFSTLISRISKLLVNPDHKLFLTK